VGHSWDTEQVKIGTASPAYRPVTAFSAQWHLLLNPMFDDMEHLELLAQEVMPHL